MQRHVRTIAPLALAALMSVPAAAAEPGWTLRLTGVWGQPNLDLPTVTSDVSVDTNASGALGAGAFLEYRVHRWAALGLDALHTRPDVVLAASLPGGRVSVSDSLSFTPLTAGPVFHLTPGRAVDVTLAAMFGVAVHGDLRFAAGSETLDLQGDRAICWGLGAAVDIYPGASKWGLHAGVKRYGSNATFTNRANGGTGRAAVNPIAVTVGVAYRF